MQERTIQAGGIRTHYLEAGKGAPLILVHGGGAGADAWGNWKDCLPFFAERFRVLAIDLVGFGKTEKPEPETFEYSEATRIRHLADFIRAAGLERASLVGNSLGGGTSLGVAMAPPELVDHLVLMSSAALMRQVNPALRGMINYVPSRENMRDVLLPLVSDGFQIDGELVEYRYRITQQPGVMKAYRAIMSWIAGRGGLYFDEADIATVRHRTLVVNGRNDRVTPPEIGWRLSQLLEESAFFVMPGVAHWVMIERPRDFAALTTWFLESN
jgi:2-hydroxy-6-oxo-6-(2'-aminophenyl)hexa-2,4-dienoate hydrolase